MPGFFFVPSALALATLTSSDAGLMQGFGAEHNSRYSRAAALDAVTAISAPGVKRMVSRFVRLSPRKCELLFTLPVNNSEGTMNCTALTKLVVCAFVGSLTLVLPTSAQIDKAATAHEASPSPVEKKPKRKVYKGVIESIDMAAHTVTVKKATTSKTFKVAENVKFATSGNNNASLAPLKEGDLVNVRFTEDGGIPIAHHIAQASRKTKPPAQRE
jgi:Cu/Ag efflux protein CusF